MTAMKDPVEILSIDLSNKVRIAISCLTEPNTQYKFATSSEIADHILKRSGIGKLDETDIRIFTQHVSAALSNNVKNKSVIKSVKKIQSRVYNTRGLQWGYSLSKVIVLQSTKSEIEDNTEKETFERGTSNVEMEEKLKIATAKLMLQSVRLQNLENEYTELYEENRKLKEEILPNLTRLLEDMEKVKELKYLGLV